MKKMTLDQDDRRALAMLGSYLMLLGCVLLGLLVLGVSVTLILSLCLRLFEVLV